MRNVTHELKNPITTVGVAIEALSDFNVLDHPERTWSNSPISPNTELKLAPPSSSSYKRKHPAFEDAEPWSSSSPIS
ncbi:MAG: hypothetical protein IPJ40_20315 [Saprospirales bacterium]|nr:hypothetical protein [Saprospirales bacterium]